METSKNEVLYHINTRIPSSLDKLDGNGGLIAGRLDFYMPAVPIAGSYTYQIQFKANLSNGKSVTDTTFAGLIKKLKAKPYNEEVGNPAYEFDLGTDAGLIDIVVSYKSYAYRPAIKEILEADNIEIRELKKKLGLPSE